jgi:hypothetical protein
LRVVVVVVLTVKTMETTVVALATAVQPVAVLAHINRETQATAFMVVLLDQTVQPILEAVLVGMLMAVLVELDMLAVRVWS